MSVSGTIAVQQGSVGPLFLYPGEQVDVVLTVPANATCTLDRAMPGGGTMGTLATFTASTTGTRWKNETGQGVYLQVTGRTVPSPITAELRDVTGDQTLVEDPRGGWYAADGTRVAVVTDLGIFGLGGSSVLNVMDPAFGAVGDGVTDDTAAIQAAIDASIARGIGTVFLPPGTYSVTTLTDTSQIVFIGPNARFTKGIYYIEDANTSGNITLPAGFEWLTDAVRLNADGSGSTAFDIDAHRPAVTTRYYVRHTGGNDSNDGLTFATALATIAAALAKTDVDEIVLQAGEWDRDAGAWGIHTLTRDVAMTVIGGGVAQLLGGDLGVGGDWAPDGTFPDVYVRTRDNLANHRAVWDALYPDAAGDWMSYPSVASVAAVDALPGSYYSNGTQVYVRCIDDRAPDDDLLVMLDTSATVTGPFTFWHENIQYLGIQTVGCRAATEGARPTYYAKNCQFKYTGVDSSPGRGGLRVGGGDVYLVGCTAARNRYDGFSYHSYDGTLITPVARVLEVDCIGRHNGELENPTAGNNQGSTQHDGGSIVRINGAYFDNEGEGVADVHEGTTSYNIGTNAYNSRKATLSRNYESGNDSAVPPTQMWLVSCRSGGRRDFDAITVGTSLLRTYRTRVNSYSGTATNFTQFNPFIADS